MVAKKKENKKMTVEEISTFMNEKFEGFQINEGSYEDIPRIGTGIPDLDIALGGGWPRGKVIELYGEQGSGKTWILTKTYANSAKNGTICAHFDIETSYNKKFARANGVDFKYLVLKDQIGEMDYAENIFEQIQILCETKSVDLIGVDSVAALIPKSVLEGKYEDRHISPLARMMSSSLSRIANIASKTDTSIVFINQTRTAIGKFSPYGTPTDTPGGKALKFFASVRLEVKKKMPNKTNNPDMYDGEDPIAHFLKIHVTKNKTAPPFKKCELELRYVPRDPHEEIILFALSEALIVKNPRNHKKFTYKNDIDFQIEEKNNLQMIWDYMKKSGKVIEMISELGNESYFPILLELNKISQKEIDDYFNSKK